MAEKMTLARPYAKAAFQHALLTNTLNDWSIMLSNMTEMVTNKEVNKIITNPNLTRVKRAEFFTATKLFDDKFNNFINLVSENDRLTLIPQIAELYNQLKAQHNVEANVLVTSASELDSSQKESLEKNLAKRFNKKININFEINKDLIGGIVIKNGDDVIDGSIKGQLKKLISTLVA